MRCLLICPAEKPNVTHLSEYAPLVNLSLCGKPFVFYWIEFLVAKGARNIHILATDRPHMVRELVGDGSRWGISIEIMPERRELSIQEAEQKYGVQPTDFLPAPYHVCFMDHLPEQTGISLFATYADFYQAASELLPHTASPDRIGLREIQPGIWVGLHTKLPATIKFTAPCWIGDCVLLGENVELGPGAILENQVVVDSGATIRNSLIGSDTFIGSGTEVSDSLVSKSNLINWKFNSAIQITDPFLLGPLNEENKNHNRPTVGGRLAALLCLAATAPLAFLWIMISHLRAQTVLREIQAVDPHTSSGRMITCYEFANCSGLWQRWPQLWNIVLGEFTWVGNRPLSPQEASELTTDFEKLWLKAPIGLVSKADGEGCCEKLSDEARAHASYYSTHPSAMLNFETLWKVVTGCGKRHANAPIILRPKISTEEITLSKTVSR